MRLWFALLLLINSATSIRVRFQPEPSLRDGFASRIEYAEFLLIADDSAAKLDRLLDVKTPLPVDLQHLPDSCVDSCGAMPSGALDGVDLAIQLVPGLPEHCGSTGLAYASPCCRDARTDRPIAGEVWLSNNLPCHCLGLP